jgi:hypothetical protein
MRRCGGFALIPLRGGTLAVCIVTWEDYHGWSAIR